MEGRPAGTGTQPQEETGLMNTVYRLGSRMRRLTSGYAGFTIFAGNRQGDTGALDLEEGETGLAGDALQVGQISRSEDKGAGFATAHGATSRQEMGRRPLISSITAAPNSLQGFWPRATCNNPK